MEEIARESRFLHDNLQRQAQQGLLNQQAQTSHEAETLRLKEELSHMRADNLRRRETDGGNS